MSVNDQQWADPWAVSQKLRSNFRQEKRQKIDHMSKDSNFLDKHGLNLKLLPSAELDEYTAKTVAFGEKDHDSETVKTRILSKSIFPASSNSKVSDLDKVINRHKIKVDPFTSSHSTIDKSKGKLVIKNESTKKNTLEQLSYYSSETSD